MCLFRRNTYNISIKVSSNLCNSRTNVISIIPNIILKLKRDRSLCHSQTMNRSNAIITTCHHLNSCNVETPLFMVTSCHNNSRSNKDAMIFLVVPLNRVGCSVSPNCIRFIIAFPISNSHLCLQSVLICVSVFYRYKLRHTRTLAVNLENLTNVPDHVFELAAAENVHVVDFARNQLRALPNG